MMIKNAPIRISLSLISFVWILFGCLILPRNSGSTPPAGGQSCTAMGCGFTLQIELVGSVPSEFILSAAASNGEIVSVHCRDGAVVYDAETTANRSLTCGGNQVAFLDFSPVDVTISVESSLGKVSKDFHPDYKTFRPNGPNCEPECRSARIEFLVTKIDS